MRTSKLQLGVLSGLVGAMFFGQVSFADGTATLVAVKKNNVAITPTTDIALGNAAASDVFEVEIFIIGWPDIDVARGYQVRIAGQAGSGDGETNGAAGILPVGWEAPVSPQVCHSNIECTTAPYSSCYFQGSAGICVAPSHSPEQGAFVTTNRSDFVLNGSTTIYGGVTTFNLNYIFGFTNDAFDGAPDFGVPYYAGTLKLAVKPGACGDYVWGATQFDFGTFQSFVIDEVVPPTTVPLASVPLTIHMPACKAGIMTTVPPVCAIEAQYPTDPINATIRYGFNGTSPDTLVLTFNRNPGVLTPASFAVTTVPGGVNPVISSVQQNGLQATLNFDRVIPSTKWTCVTQTFGELDKACIGSLGADTNQSTLSDSSDTLAIKAALDGGPVLAAYKSDLDRSLKFTPLDLLASIDLLNGAGALNLFNGISLSACPTTGIQIP